jgi:hypothetical protein
MGDGTQDMTQGIEIHFDEDEGHLRLDCSEAEFLHIRDLVISEASTDGRLTPFVDGIRSIVVRRSRAGPGTQPRRSRRPFLILLVSFALGASVAIQVVGIVAAVRWLLGLDR